MNVLHVDSQKTWRGGENQASLLIAGLRARGIGVAGVGRAGTPWVERLTQAGVQVFNNELRPTPPALWKLRTAYREFQPQVVHCHDSGSIFSAAMAAAGMGRRKPRIVVSRRVDFAINSTFKYNYLCDRIIAIGRAVTAVLEQGGVDPERVRIVPSGIDPARFARLQPRETARQAFAPPAGAGDFVALCAAALSDHKDHRTLIAAWRRVADRQPQAHLYLAGEGELEADLRAQVAELHLEGQVHFLGWRDDVPDLLVASDLFVMTSHLEGLGTTLMDAQFCGVPVVATLAGGIPEVIEQQVTGVLVEPKNPAAVAQAVLDLIADPARRDTMGKAGRLRAQQLFTCDRMVEQTLNVYQELL